MSLSELGVLFGGLSGKTKQDFGVGDSKFIPYANVFANSQTDLQALGAVRVLEGERQNAVRFGDILFTGSSENLDEVATASVVLDEPGRDTYLNSFCIGYRPNDLEQVQPAFARHLFRSIHLRSQLIQTANGVTRFNVSRPRLLKVRVPLLTSNRQAEIAETLDSFEALANNLSYGLPAELAARRKQYEYYRDRLLTFEEAAS